MRITKPPESALVLPSSLERDPYRLYLASLGSPRSRASMISALGRAARELAVLDGVDEEARTHLTAEHYCWGAPGALTYGRVSLAIAAIATTHKSTARLALAALRGVARAAANLDLLPGEECRRIVSLRGPRLSASLRGRALAVDEVASLYGACAADLTPRGRRDAALVAVMLGAGLRRFEASALDLEDYAPGPSFAVRHGKGDKAARIHAPPDVGGAIEDWLAVRGRAAGPLFWSSGGRGRGLRAGQRLSAGGVYQVLVGRAAEAGIAQTAPHDLRRSMITDFLERTGDLALAQRQARHASPATTAKYDKRQESALKRCLFASSTGYRAH